MLRTFSICLVFTFAAFTALCQSKFIVKVSHDTILLDEALRVEFIIENVEGEFTPPSFDGFTIASGPMTSSSFTMINGEVTQKKSISFLLIPKDMGLITLTPARVAKGDKEFRTESIDIYVLDRNSSYRRSTKGDKMVGKPNSTPSKKRVLNESNPC